MMASGMPSAKLLTGGAVTTAALGLRVARSLYGRRRDRERAGRDPHAAGERLAATPAETAQADPEIGEHEVRELREELRRELERLATDRKHRD
jgi:hypothetical protein